MTGERVTQAAKDRAPSLDIDPAKLAFDGKSTPFNRGPRYYRYRPSDLRDAEGERRGRTDRTRFFEETVVSIHAETGRDVPVLFRLRDGSLRSLDAGCLGFLYNRDQPDLALKLDRNGFITSVRPTKALRQRISPKIRNEFTQIALNERGAAPAMAFLLSELELGHQRVTYAEVARHLNTELGLQNVVHHHVGGVIDAMMERLVALEPNVPLLNVLVMRRDQKTPGKGVDGYLKTRFDLARKPRGEARRACVEAAVNQVRVYPRWRELYQQAFGVPFVESPRRTEEFDGDGQGDNPKYGKSGPRTEGPEHKALKAFVRDNPHVLRLKLTSPQAKNEGVLPSGDRLDVEIIDGDRRIGVEVKSIRSGDEDLRRGLYQCVKYQAVMDAQARVSGGTPSEVLLVTERQLPSDLVDLARALGVRRKVVRVN